MNLLLAAALLMQDTSIEELIAMLRFDKVEVRNNAARELRNLRESAIPALERLAKDSDIEVSHQANEILFSIRKPLRSEAGIKAYKQIEDSIAKAKTIEVSFTAAGKRLGIPNDFVEHGRAWEMAEQSDEIHCRFRVADTRRTMEVVGAALHLYRLEQGRYPARLLDLAERPSEIDPSAWRLGGYLGQIPLYSWGREFVYRVQGRDRESYDLISLGMDGKEGGEGFDADIVYEKRNLPEEKK